jgi:hypothetical protein
MGLVKLRMEILDGEQAVLMALMTSMMMGRRAVTEIAAS